MGLVMDELAFDHFFVGFDPFATAVSYVHDPVTVIAFAVWIGEDTITVFLAVLPKPFVFTAVSPESDAVACDLAVSELTLVVT